MYWTALSQDGHLVMSLHLPNAKVSEAELVAGGPTMIGHLELSADGEYLLLADDDMDIIEKVKISDKEVSFLTKYGAESFYPGT